MNYVIVSLDCKQKDRSGGFLSPHLDACPASRFWLWPLIQCKWGPTTLPVTCTATLYVVRLVCPDNATLLPLSLTFFPFRFMIRVLLCQFFLFFYLFILWLASISVFECQTSALLTCSPWLAPLSRCHRGNGWSSSGSYEAFLKYIAQVQSLTCFLQMFWPKHLWVPFSIDWPSRS